MDLHNIQVDFGLFIVFVFLSSPHHLWRGFLYFSFLFSFPHHPWCVPHFSFFFTRSCAHLPSTTPQPHLDCHLDCQINRLDCQIDCLECQSSVAILGLLAHFISFPHHPWCGFLYFFVANLYSPSLGKWSLPTPQETDAYPSLLFSSLPPPSVRFAPLRIVP